MNTIFMRFKVLLFVMHCNLYFYSHSHSLQFAISSVWPAYYILMHKISLLYTKTVIIL